MGIPSYFSYIVKNHFTLLQKKSVLQVDMDIDHFYLDSNSIIYDVVRKMNFSEITKDETEHIINAIFYTIDGYIQTIQPRETIFIAFDGVAPMAKLNQQRERRYKSVFQNKISKNIFKDTRPDSWNTTAITPGTRFMNRLSERIHAYYNDPIKYACKKIIVSTSEEPGEGEHKLFDYIRKNPKEHFNKVTVVYGLDADLIMLCIHHLPICEKIYLYRETPEFIKSIHAELEPNEEYFLDIFGLAKCIVEHMKNNDNTETKETKKQKKQKKPKNKKHCFYMIIFFFVFSWEMILCHIFHRQIFAQAE
jgi:5'-3' exonuclease